MQPYLKSHPGATRDDYDAAVADIVRDARPDLVVLAGWMHVLGTHFLDRLQDVPVINLHPALPGAFEGTHAIERAYEAFQKGEVDKAGVMVHRVIREVDRGEPLVVKEVPIEKGEPLEAFEERLHKVEWQAIVEGTAKALGV
ncbi:formyl transferase [Schizophyllum commune]